MNKVPSCIVCVDVSIWLHSTLEANDVEYLIKRVDIRCMETFFSKHPV